MEKISKKICGEHPVYQEKILQFGEGNFLRAFVDWQIDVLNKKTDFNGSVVVVQPRGSEKIERLNEQDGLFTLYLQGMKEGKAVNEHMIVNSISRGIDLVKDYDKYVDLAGSEELRFIISNATEAGIYLEATDRLEDRPQKSFPGKLTAFLFHRFKAFKGDSQKGCIIIPCELIEENGAKLRDIVLQLANSWNLGKAFIEWILHANTFCNSLVDRIVPGFPKDRVDEITEELGYQDDLLVVGELYHQWVIEGPQWIKKEFPIDQVGLNTFFVDDLTPYRVQKVRILNGVHTAMTPVAYLAGVGTVAEAMEDETTGQFIKELTFEEIIPTLDMPTEELRAFANDVLNRFKNPYIKHYLLSISLNSLSKFKTRNIPALLDYMEKKQELPRRMVFSLSALLIFYKGKRGEEMIPLEDDPSVLELFKASWKSVAEDTMKIEELVETILGNQDIWGMDLNGVSGLTKLVAEYVHQMEDLGIKPSLEAMMREQSVK
jgi:tagaturonate reductase